MLSSDAATAIRPCLEAVSREALVASLQELSPRISQTNDNVREELALLLMKDITIIGSGDDNIALALDKCLDACSPQVTLAACSQTLLEAANVTMESPSAMLNTLRTIRRLLLTLPATENDVWNISTAIPQHDLVTNISIEQMAATALLFPVQIANACHKQKLVLPAWSPRSKYCPRLVECAFQSHALAGTVRPEVTIYLQRIIQKLLHMGGSDEVAMGLHRYYHQCRPLSAVFAKQLQQAMLPISTPRDNASLLRSIVQHLITTVDPNSNVRWDIVCDSQLKPYLMLTCKPILEASSDIREAWVRSMILSSSPVPTDSKIDRMMCHVVALILEACDIVEEDDDSDEDNDEDVSKYQIKALLQRHLHAVALVWAETVFVQHTDRRSQRHVAYFIQSALSLLRRELNDPTSPIISTLFRGVTARLDSSTIEIRKDGMRVAELLADILGQPLRFEELNDDREDAYDMENPVEVETSKTVDQDNRSVSSDTMKLKADQVRRVHRKQPKRIDPDEDYFTDEDESDESERDQGSAANLRDDDDDSVWDDNDELVPYDLSDDEADLRETPSPLYLRECLNLLRAPDNDDAAYSKHEVGLQAAAGLIRSNPVDLPDLVVPLSRQLLHMENKFNVKNFAEYRQDSLLALVVGQPVAAGECLIGDLFGGAGLGTRLDVLYTLQHAAFELCGSIELSEHRRKQNNQSRLEPIKSRVAGKRRLVADEESMDDNVERALASFGSRTRRWGKGRLEANSISVVNRFGPVAPIWFYVLTSGFLRHKDDTALWGGANGARLLASFIMTLATIVDCSGYYSGTEVLAKDLVDMVWSFRTVEVPEVRKAVLVAIANGLGFLREDSLMSVLCNEAYETLPEFLSRTAIEDTDENCRSLARMISRSVSQTVGDWGNVLQTK